MGSEARVRLGLAGLLGVTLISFQEVFATGAYIGPAFLGALIAVAITVVVRRLGGGAPASFGASTACLLWYLALVFESHELYYGLPTPGAAAGLWRSVSDAYAASQVDVAPISLRAGYVVLMVVALWVATTAAEVATFRWKRPILAALPCLGLFSISLVVGQGRATVLLIPLFLIALLSYWGLESSQRLRSWGRWIHGWTEQADEQPSSVVGRMARRMATASIVGALIAPVLLPSVREGAVAWRNTAGGGSSNGARVDLLVSLAPTLVNNSTDELFRVRAREPAYWRLVSLARFDGQTWQPDDDGRVPVESGILNEASAAGSAPGSYLEQRFDLTGLRAEFLPAAVDPVRVDLPSDAAVTGTAEILVDPDDRDLKVEGSTQSLQYSVTSWTPDLSSRALLDASVAAAPVVYTEVPELSQPVRNLLRRWTDEATTPLEKLTSIQDHLREFDYSLDVERKASSDYLTEFLTKTREGYCQQFATAFALLARSLGFPTRVSVGFLPGDPSGKVDDELIVRGMHAHAWPEVRFERFGWVRFEPTPRYAAVRPDYAASVAAPRVERLDRREAAPQRGVENRQLVPAGRGADPEFGGDVPNRRDDARWTPAFTRLASGLVALMVAFGLAVPALKEWRVRRRYRRAHDPASEAIAAFAHFEQEAGDLIALRAPSESATTYASRVASSSKAPRASALQLAVIYDAAEYSPTGVPAEQASKARRLAQDLRRWLWRQASWGRRATRLFSPRGLGDFMALLRWRIPSGKRA